MSAQQSSDRPPFSHFTRYSGDVKESHQDLPLGRKTVITGPECSYKTAIPSGIRLAITGKFPEVGHNPTDLLSLAADPTYGMHNSVSSPDGTFEWRLPVDPATARAKEPIGPTASGRLRELTEDERYCIIPSLAVNDLLKGARGDRKLREALIRRWGEGLDAIPSPYPVAAPGENDFFAFERQLWDSTVAQVKAKSPGETVEGLLAALTETLRSTSLAKNKEAKALEKTLAAQRKSMAAASSGTEELDKLEAQLKNAKAWEGTADTRVQATLCDALVERLQEEIDIIKVDDTYKRNAWQNVEAQWRAQLAAADAAASSALAEMKQSYRKLGNSEVNRDVFTKMVSEQRTKCPYCASEMHGIEHVESVRNTFENRVAERSLVVANAEQAYEAAIEAYEVAATSWQNLQQEENERMSNVTYNLQTKTAQLAQEEKRLASLQEQLSRMVPYTGPTTSELETRILALRAAKNARASLVFDEAKLAKLQKEHELLKKLEKDATALQKTFMVQVAKTASEEVSRCMPGGRKAVLDPETCDWYIIRPDGQKFGPVGTLSGTEQTSLKLGFCAAWTAGAPLRLAIFDDPDMIGLSDKGMADFFKACDELVERGDFTQVIVCTNREKTVPRDGRWHIIEKSPIAMDPSEVEV